MIWIAVSALIVVWSFFFLPGILVHPVVLSAAVLLVWLSWGGRSALVVMIVAWTVLNAGAVLENRLPVSLSRQDILLSGTICRFPRSGEGARGSSAIRFHLDTDTDALNPHLPKRFYISWYDSETPPAIGDRWQLKVRVKEPRGLGNPAGFDYERWLFAEGTGGTGYVRPSGLNQRLENTDDRCRLGTLRGQIAQAIQSALPGHPGLPYLQGLIVGARHLLNDEQWELLRRTGTVHLMAISGLHIGLVAMVFYWLGKQFARLCLVIGIRNSPLFWGRWCGVLAAVIYSALAGFSVSTVRAVIMLGVAALLVGRRHHHAPADVLCMALLAVLCVDPFAVLSSGFWLSFSAVALLMLQWLQLVARPKPPGGAATWLRRIEHSGRILVKAQFLLGVGLAAFTIGYFQQLSVIGPVANLIAVPVFSIAVIPLALAGGVAVMIFPEQDQWLLQLAANIVEQVVHLLAWLNQSPSSIWVPLPISDIWLFVIFAGCLLLIWPRPVPLRWLAPLLLLPAFFTVPLSGSRIPGTGDFRLIVADVGQGLAILIQTSEGTLLYDSGPSYGNRDAGAAVLLPLMAHYGIQKLDRLVVSHGDSDHAGGAASVINAHSEAQLVATSRFGLTPTSFVRCQRGLQWSWGGVFFKVLHPGREGEDHQWTDNDSSCVLRVESRFGSVLLPGDIESRAERYLVRNRLLEPVDLVVAPHHGSKTSSGLPFVRAVQARYVVFPVGYANRWGFPQPSVVQRWVSEGGRIVDTATSGAMVFDTMSSGQLELVWQYRVAGRKLWTYQSPAE